MCLAGCCWVDGSGAWFRRGWQPPNGNGEPQGRMSYWITNVCGICASLNSLLPRKMNVGLECGKWSALGFKFWNPCLYMLYISMETGSLVFLLVNFRFCLALGRLNLFTYTKPFRTESHVRILAPLFSGDWEIITIITLCIVFWDMLHFSCLQVRNLNVQSLCHVT